MRNIPLKIIRKESDTPDYPADKNYPSVIFKFR